MNRDSIARLRAVGLTARECDVIYWIAEGKRDGEIATILGCSLRTVNKHVQNVLRKAGVKTRLGAARVARGWLAQSPVSRGRHEAMNTGGVAAKSCPADPFATGRVGRHPATQALLRRMTGTPPAAPNTSERTGSQGDFHRLRPAGLTKRQCEVLGWIAEGKRDAEIAAIMGVTRKCVSKHVEHLLKRLHAENRATAVSIALELLRVSG